MAYNKTTLLAELQADPMTLGYASLVAANNDVALAALLNDKTKGGTIDKVYITANELQSCVVASEFTALTSTQIALWQAILVAASGAGIPIADIQIRQQLGVVFPNGGAGTTKAKINVAQQRAGSRAEALWGDGTVVSAGDVSLALRS